MLPKDDVFNFVIQGKDLETLKILPKEVPNTKTIQKAVATKDRKIMQYLIDQGYSLSVGCFYTALMRYDFDTVKFLCEKNCPWDSEICATIAAYNPSMLKYIRERGCPWDEETAIALAGQNEVELLAYAIDNGIHIDARTCAEAA